MEEKTPVPADRALLEGPAGELFREVVDTGALCMADERATPRDPRFEVLLRLGLLAPDEHDERYLPVDPCSLAGQLVTPLGRTGADLMDQSARWAGTLGALGAEYHRNASGRVPLEVVRGLDNINRFLTAAVEDAQLELLTAQPTLGRSERSLERAAERDIKAVSRGVQMRTLYQHNARHSSAIQRYVELITPHGAQVRTLDEFFKRLIVVDRRMAIVPGVEAGSSAVVVHEPGLVDFLVDIFERNWQRARAYDDRQETTNKLIASDVRRLITRILREGYSDGAGAKRAGVSERTFAGYVAALKEEFDADTRFQLGYALGQEDARSADAEF